MRTSVVLAAVVVLLASAEPVALAQSSPSAPATPDAHTPSRAGTQEGTPSADPAARTMLDLEKAPPPPTNIVYLQYGVAFTAEFPSSSGPICDNSAAPCILGPGGGIAVRAGWRGAGALYLGGAYELSKQDPNKLYRLALLQQARFEGRYYLVSGRDVEPYAVGGVGVAGYGNEWAIDTWGPGAFLGGGIEVQITRRTVVGLALAYRGLWFKSFKDTSGADRGAGLSQMVGLDLVLEQRDPIFTRTVTDRPPNRVNE